MSATSLPSQNRPARIVSELAKPVFFVGFMGAGKTSVARKLARTCGIASVDMDTYLERREGKRVRELFAEAGEAVRLAGGGNALVVTHSFVVRTLVYLLAPARVNDPAKIPNASVTRIGYDGHAFSLAEIGSTAWQR